MEISSQRLVHRRPQLDGAKPAQLFFDKPRPAKHSGSFGTEAIVIPDQTVKILSHFSRSQRTTLFATLLGAFRVTHFRLTGIPDATIGAYHNKQSRQELDEANDMIQCIQIPVSGGDSFKDVVQRVSSATLDMRQDQNVYPSEIITEPNSGDSDKSEATLPRITFVVDDQLGIDDDQDHEGPMDGTRRDIEIRLARSKDGLRGCAVYAGDLFFPDTIRNMLSVFYTVIEQSLEEPDVPVSSTLLTDHSSYQRGWDQVRIRYSGYPRESSIIHLFRQQVAISPDVIAIKDTTSELTYSQLDQLSERVARWLALRRLEPDTLVGVFAGNSCRTIVAFIGILKASLAYVPLDVRAPPSRMETILSSIHDRVIVLYEKEAPTLGNDQKVDLVPLDHALEETTDTTSGQPHVTNGAPQGPSATSLAYVMFTSGSTGRPKGVMVEHRGIIRLARQTSVTSHMETGTKIAHLTNITFDLSTWEIYTALLNGGTLICFDKLGILDAVSSRKKFVDENIKMAIFTPTLLQQYLDEALEVFRSLDMLLSCGEALQPRVARGVLDNIGGRFVNVYGPTEDTGFATWFEVTREESLPKSDSFQRSVPIGKAIDDSGSVILDSHQRLVPNGVIGELVLFGDGLARGYLDPEHDKNRFITMTIDGSLTRAYRTGDLARRRPSDGVMEFLGRMDNQVKIRGHRVELGEVEHALLAFDCVTNAAALVQTEPDADSRLFAFITVRRAGEPDDHDSVIDSENMMELLYDFIRTKLPTYMIPASIKIVDRMPTNQSRKIDRSALARLIDSTRDETPKNRVAPRDGTEQAVFEEFVTVLGTDLGITESFFNLGGHSLMATKVISRINKRLGVALKIGDIFECPTVEKLSQKAKPDLGSVPYQSIPKVQHDGPVEQSFAQGRLWFLDQLNPNSTSFLWQSEWRLQGPLDISALRSAVRALEARHESLRTTFEQQDGVGLQMIRPPQPKDVKVVQFVPGEEELNKMIENEQMRPFNLQAETGWRVAVFQLSENDHVLSIVMHHIIQDGWSMDVLRAELSQFYSAALQGKDPLAQVPGLPIQYRDFSVWQRQQAQISQSNAQLAYWKRQLEGSQPAELICDKPRPTILSGQAGKVGVRIEGPLYRKLQEACADQQVTPFVVLMSAFRATHFRLTGAADATIGAPIANRNRQELEGLFGFFVNTQCIRMVLEENETFETLIQQTRTTAVTAFENQDVPFEQIVAEMRAGKRDASRNPLVQLSFAVHAEQDFGKLALEGLQVTQSDTDQRTRFDIEFHLHQEKAGFSGYVLYAEDLFYPETIHDMVDVFHEILGCGLENLHTPIATLALTRGTSRSCELAHVRYTDYPRDSSIVDVFRGQVALSPDTVAVQDASTKLTYIQLDQQSNKLARWLVRQRPSVEAFVGVYMRRSCEAIVAFLGILKAGLAYVPLDTDAPPERIATILGLVPEKEFIILECEVPVPVTNDHQVRVVQMADTLQDESGLSNGWHSPSHSSSGPSPTSLAYVMFTSGSTGNPKGVLTEQRGVVRLAKQDDAVALLPTGTKVAHLATIAFDASTWEIYTAILNGGTLVCIDKMTVLSPSRLGKLFLDEDIRMTKMTPALLEQCVDEIPGLLHTVDVLLSSGDRLHPHVARKVREQIRGRFFNAYGPTESTGHSTCHAVTRDEALASIVPIGQAIGNSGAVIMDPLQRIVPPGVVGELLLTGDGLARGYLDARQNENRFVEILIENSPVRAYRTGDNARRRPRDGEIEFLGRMDRQVKVRGYRIELGEIEHALLRDASVNDAVVLAQGDGAADHRLMAFVTLRSDQLPEEWSGKAAHEEEVEEVEAWAEVRQSTVYANLDAIDPKEFGRDFVGWVAMYDGQQFAQDDMEEWLQDTLRTILNGRDLVHVLEVGTGTGMIAFNLVEHLQTYVGLEPVPNAVELVNKVAQSNAETKNKVKVHLGTAADVYRAGRSTSPTTVIINSVAQYFPSLDYLDTVVADLLRSDCVSRIFFGDIRSYSLYREFQVTMARYHVGERPSKDSLRRYMEQLEQSEKEFLIDPAYFTALKQRYPDRIEHVEILPKRMKALNELSCYRYAAVVHIKGTTVETGRICRIDEQQWIDFTANQMDAESLLQRLQSTHDTGIIAVTNIPYKNTYLERSVLDTLEKHGEASIDWTTLTHRASCDRASMTSMDLVTIAKKAQFQVEISWARQFSQRGGFDAVFHRQHEEGRVLYGFPTDHEDRSLASFTNRPLQHRRNRKVEQTLHNDLRARLPSYMVPASIRVLDKMPMNQSRKIDHKALAKMAATSPDLSKDHVAPRNDTEKSICGEFTAILGVNAGITDNFFELGGHSLMATRAVSRINQRLGCNLSIFEFYHSPTPAALSELISAESELDVSQAPPSWMHHHQQNDSKATVVLIHGFWGQGNLFLPLIPLLSRSFDVIVIHDPFFGTSESPETIEEWGRLYLRGLSRTLRKDHPVILGGFSFGGLIAFEMASIWHTVFATGPASLLLLDAGTCPSLTEYLALEDIPEESLVHALTIFGDDQEAMVRQHFTKQHTLSFGRLEQYIHEGDCLYLTTLETGSEGWWTAHCPDSCVRQVDSGHYDMLGPTTVRKVAQLINEHYSELAA